MSDSTISTENGSTTLSKTGSGEQPAVAESNEARPARELPVAVYSAQSSARSPIALSWEILGDCWRAREMIWILFLRDLRAMYRQTYFGYAWIVAPPVATTAVWLYLNSQKIVRVAETPIPYAAYVLVGTTLWTTFSAGVLRPLAAFHSGKAVFMKINVPPEAFVAAAVSRVVFDFLIRLVVVVPVLIYFQVSPSTTLILFPLAVLCLVVMATAVGLAFVPLGALYRDVERGLSVILGFAMYLTPIVYPPAESGLSATIIRMNPVTPLIMAARDTLTGGGTDYLMPMLLVTGVAVALLIASAVVLRVSMPHLVARMGM